MITENQLLTNGCERISNGRNYYNNKDGFSFVYDKIGCRVNITVDMQLLFIDEIKDLLILFDLIKSYGVKEG